MKNLKKTLSLLLVIVMVIGLLPMNVLATNSYDQDYTGDMGTNVSYIGGGTEGYKITVPAILAPGASGNVTVEGTWASNRVLNVTADDKVILTNSIDNSLTKELVVTFGGISKAGSNTVAIKTTDEGAYATVSVSEITNALFGTWSGYFEYQVGISTINGEVVMLEGDGQVVNKFAFPEVRFRSSAPVDTLNEVKINGEVVDPDNYIVTEGSTVIIFTNEYVESLKLTEDGKQHSIEIVSEGGTANAGFTVINVIPEGGLYITVDEEKFGPGEKFPESPQSGDMYYYGDYEYCYGYQWCINCGMWSNIFCFCGPKPIEIDHWGLHVNVDYMDKSEYDLPLTQINGDCISDWTGAFYDCDLTKVPDIPNTVTILDGTFSYCRKLTDVSNMIIPNSVTSMNRTFAWCNALTNTPIIPNSVTSMKGTFSYCKSLTDLSDFVIPDGVTNLYYTFYSCSNLVFAPKIPEGVTSMDNTFAYCDSLIKAPIIPNSVTNMYGAFLNCDSLTDLSKFVIPNSVTNMDNTFAYCDSLIKAPIIPEGVTSLVATFNGCTALTDAPVIPNSVTDMSYTFCCCSSLKNAPVVHENVTSLTATFASCTSLTGVVEINANPNDAFIWNCFGAGSISGISYDKVDFAKQNITLVGTSTMLDQIGATGLNYCATCNGVCQNNH